MNATRDGVLLAFFCDCFQTRGRPLELDILPRDPIDLLQPSSLLCLDFFVLVFVISLLDAMLPGSQRTVDLGQTTTLVEFLLERPHQQRSELVPANRFSLLVCWRFFGNIFDSFLGIFSFLAS